MDVRCSCSLHGRSQPGRAAAIELHLRKDPLALLLGRLVQQMLGVTCSGPLPNMYIDHADPVPEDAEWDTGGGFGPGFAALCLPVAVTVLSRDEVLAAVNSTPVGALPSVRVTLVIRVAVAEAAITVKVTDVDFGLAEGSFGDAEDTIKAGIVKMAGDGQRIELGELLAGLGIDLDASPGTIDLTSDLLVARFGDLTGPPAPVAHSFEWGLFLDGRTMEGLLTNSDPVVDGTAPELRCDRSVAGAGGTGLRPSARADDRCVNRWHRFCRPDRTRRATAFPLPALAARPRNAGAAHRRHLQGRCRPSDPQCHRRRLTRRHRSRSLSPA